MFKKQIEQFKNMFNKNGEGGNKKSIENLVFFLILLIITIIAINVIWNDKKPKNDENKTNTQLVDIENTITQNINNSSSEYNLQNNLKTILGKINGAGNVEVLITYKETSELVPIYNENSKKSVTEEKDTSGGTRIIEQNDNSKEVVYTEDNGEKQPITQKIVMPQIEGAIILAEGANNAEVKNTILQAVEAVTGLSVHKIQVFQMEKN